MKLSNEWFTTISESESGAMIIISGRDGIREFIKSGKFKERAEISWKYSETAAAGMPTEELAEQMEEVQESLQKAFEKNKLAILTGIYTGDNERTWVFYTRNIPAFGETLNSALQSFNLLPITIYTEKDADWNEYYEMYACKAINGDNDDDEETID